MNFLGSLCVKFELLNSQAWRVRHVSLYLLSEGNVLVSAGARLPSCFLLPSGTSCEALDELLNPSVPQFSIL